MKGQLEAPVSRITSNEDRRGALRGCPVVTGLRLLGERQISMSSRDSYNDCACSVRNKYSGMKAMLQFEAELS